MNVVKALKKNGTKGIGAGFSEVTLPKADVTTITYRENNHPTRFVKKPGLTRYEPILLKKGVTQSTELYDWYSLVNNDAIGFSVTSQLVGGALGVPPAYPANFRKDLLICVLDREGNTIKSWVILDAFPVSFKPGNDLESQSNDKLIAELGITFEAWVEIKGEDLQALVEEADNAAANASVAAALGFTLSGGNSGGGVF
jgi:phage tail-like protein